MINARLLISTLCSQQTGLQQKSLESTGVAPVKSRDWKNNQISNDQAD